MRDDEFRLLSSLPSGSVLAVCGAGGKTTLIHRLRNAYLAQGRRVIVTTSTHMRNEGNLCRSAEEIRASLSDRGYAFAGRPDPENPSKIIGPESGVLSAAVKEADVTLVEADGARHRSFKVPYPHEPVIPPGTTHIAVLYGEEASGKVIRDVSYNPEGVAEVLGLGPGDLLDEALMRHAVERTYLEKFERHFPGIPVFCLPVRRNDTPAVHFILLAAGYSVRFGGNKLLYVMDGKPMYRHILDRLLKIREEGRLRCDITVVTQYEEILRDLRGEEGAAAAVNPDPSRGISSSIRTGLSALYGRSAPEEGDYLFFVNGDQPRLTAGTCLSFARGALESGLPLAALTCGGEMYSPCMFRTDFVPDLTALRGDRGGKSILRKNAGKVFLFEPSSKVELVDIDML